MKDSNLVVDLETMKEEMVKVQHFNDAKVISDTLRYINSLNTDMNRHIRTNKELTTIIANQASTKKNNLINFHSANVLQGMLIRGTTLGGTTLDNYVLVEQSIKLAKLIIERLKDED